MTHSNSVPNPGSDAALAQGCKCPVLDNGHGSGHGTVVIDGASTTVFVMSEDCPLHGAGDWKDNTHDPIAIEAQMMGGDLIWAPYEDDRK
jgi:hypothetical protein